MDPYPYGFTIQPSPEPELHFTINITCPDPKENSSGGYPASFTISPLTLQNSADGIDYSGSETVEEATSTTTREWSFHRTE